MNVVLFLTDQERALQHFPRGWAQQNLPGLTRLQRHGLTFERAFTNSCMCSPARSTLMTGYFPAQHGVKYNDFGGVTAPGLGSTSGEALAPDRHQLSYALYIGQDIGTTTNHTCVAGGRSSSSKQ